VPMVIRTPGDGGQQLGATHSQNIELFYSFIPGLKVMAPSTPAQASSMLRAAVRHADPVLFLDNLSLYNTKGGVADDYAVPENDWLTYGIGAEIAASIQEGAFDYLDAPVRRVAMAEVPMPYAKPLESAALPSVESISTAIKETLSAVGKRVG